MTVGQRRCKQGLGVIVQCYASLAEGMVTSGLRLRKINERRHSDTQGSWLVDFRASVAAVAYMQSGDVASRIKIGKFAQGLESGSDRIMQQTYHSQRHPVACEENMLGDSDAQGSAPNQNFLDVAKQTCERSHPQFMTVQREGSKEKLKLVCVLLISTHTRGQNLAIQQSKQFR